MNDDFFHPTRKEINYKLIYKSICCLVNLNLKCHVDIPPISGSIIFTDLIRNLEIIKMDLYYFLFSSFLLNSSIKKMEECKVLIEYFNTSNQFDLIY